MRLFYGIDIGGTNVKAGIVSEDGTILAQSSMKAGAEHNSAEQILDIAFAQLAELSASLGPEHAAVEAAGVGSPGVIDRSRRRIVRTFNLPFDNLDAASYLEARLNVPVVVGNDANVAALAESRIGAGKGVESSITVTLGTGVGGGVVINDRVYSGFNGAGCELGHVLLVEDGVPCTCGRNGCIEAYCSATALIRQTKEAAQRHPESALAEMVRSGAKISGRTPFDLAASGCLVAQGVVDRYIRHVGEAMASFINALNPERIIIGGGISHQGQSFVDAVAKVALSQAFIFGSIEAPTFWRATLGNDAGIVGAAMFAKDSADDRQL